MAEDTLRFGSGRDALRSEDDPLLCGGARFTDDVDVPGQAFAAFVSSPYGHGLLKAIDSRKAKAMPGVLAVYTGADLARDGLGTIPPAAALPGRDGKPMRVAAIPPLAVERVRYVGEPLAMVVAETLAQAEDAAGAVELELAELPVASHVESAAANGSNVALDWTDGDAAAVQAAFARAAHVEKVRLLDTRLAPSAMEPRAALGAWDA